MTTIKSHTDLEQSKKLAEILPQESADMFCADVFNKEKETHSYNFHIFSTWGCNTFEELKDRENKFLCFIPVWSFAALLGVLPYPSLHKTFAGWRCDSYDKEGKTCKLGENTDNPVDACYEMIIRLHELKML